MSERNEIDLIRGADGWWSAVDQTTGVASQGTTRASALSNLDEAVAVTQEVRDGDGEAPEPDVPWFEG